jgi:hypothetical protein
MSTTNISFFLHSTMARKKYPEKTAYAISDPTDPQAILRPNLSPIEEAVTRFTPVKLSTEFADPIIYFSADEINNPLAIFIHFFPQWLLKQIILYTNQWGILGTL